MTQELLKEPPLAGTEIDTLLGSLERGRRLIAWKCGGLDAAAMATTVGTSAVTLGGLVRHLARDGGTPPLHARGSSSPRRWPTAAWTAPRATSSSAGALPACAAYWST